MAKFGVRLEDARSLPRPGAGGYADMCNVTGDAATLARKISVLTQGPQPSRPPG